MSLEQDGVGKDFDKWFDWNGATSLPGSAIVSLPISPLSSSNHEDSACSLKPTSLTASKSHDIPTPSHSSGSPETRSSLDLRLSGETLRNELSTRAIKKRKHSSDEVSITPVKQEGATQIVKKRPHNIIEKRYRANLNEKIAELRDSVPSLRKLKRNDDNIESNGEEDDDVAETSAPSNKLNKASILTKAVEYIRHLEIRSKRLEDENRSLKKRLEVLDKVIAQGGKDSQRATAFTSSQVIEDEGQHDEDSVPPPNTQSASQPRGLIPLPESWRQLRQNQPQEHYGHLYDNPSHKSLVRGKWPTRIMIGTLAGLMIMGLGESDQGTDSRVKGLFGIPLEILDGWKFLRSPRLYLAVFAQYCRAGGVFPLVKGFTALTLLAFLVFSYLFNSKPSTEKYMDDDTIRSSQAAIPSSPIGIRRRAWSTSMQSLNIPHHQFFPEWRAVTVEWLNYTILYLFGQSVASWFSGRSMEDEKIRVKAWDIAIDAQLAGGDEDISRSRIVLTSFGAGTLPRTPLRLMLKALHCRAVLWNVGNSGTFVNKYADRAAKYFADREWQRAQKMHEFLHPRDTERLPKHLEFLLKMNCDEVFLERVVQRAYNLMYNRLTPTRHDEILLDVVTEDNAIKSPLDAIAAWRSTCALQKCLEAVTNHSPDSEIVQRSLALALKAAPPSSAAETRSLAVHAVLSTEKRKEFYDRAITSFRRPCQSPSIADIGHQTRVPIFIDASTPASAGPDIETCLCCARALLIFENGIGLRRIADTMHKQKREADSGSILSSVVVGHVTRTIPGLHEALQSLTQSQSANSSLDVNEVGYVMPQTVLEADNLCIQYLPREHKRRPSSVSNDTGYESQNDVMTL